MTRTLHKPHRFDPLMLQRAQRIAAITLASFALGTPALSQAQTPAPQQQAGDPAATAAFKRADSNQDGKLSKDEAARLPAVATRFDELDKDKDGSLSLAEFMATNVK